MHASGLATITVHDGEDHDVHDEPGFLLTMSYSFAAVDLDVDDVDGASSELVERGARC